MYVDQVFNSVNAHEGYSALIASVLFSLQIYGDFAGYSFIAIGCARILGFSFNENFNSPYFSTSITEFWRRWHISLSSWFRDYLYFPLGGSRTSKAKTYRNILITFGVSGLWHGANWTFVLWGLIHGAIQCIERALGINKKTYHSCARIFHTALSFIIVTFAWVLFRADSIGDAILAYKQIFSLSDFTMFHGKPTILYCLMTSVIVFVKECLPIAQPKLPRILESKVFSDYLWPLFLAICIGLFGVFEGSQFIYFQF